MSAITISKLLKDVEQLETPILEEFLQKALTIRAKRLAPSLEKQEADLLKKINIGLSDVDIQRKAILLQKKDANTLTPEEHQELIEIVYESERLNVERIKNVALLATLRKTTPLELMQKLGLINNHYE